MPQAQTFSSRQSEPTAQMTGEEKVWVAEGSLGLVRAVRATYFFARITAFFTGDAVGCQKTVMLFSRRASATRIFPRHCVFLLVIRKKIIPTILHIKHIKERGAAYQAYQGAWSGWLKELASNIHLISVTLDTFQLLSGWLKELAPANI